MSDQWNHGNEASDTSAPRISAHSGGHPGGEGSRNQRWLSRPRRSSGDRKVAGVAGGLGRAFGIDPVLIRVAFVVLTIFGGFGGLLYVLGWLLLPADGDEVSAAEALLGRGRSSVPPVLAVGLGVVAVISAFSTFSWGLPFLPLVVGGAIVLTIMKRRGRIGQSRQASNAWRQSLRADWMSRTDEKVRTFGEQAGQWADQARQPGQRPGCGGRRAGGRPNSWGDWGRSWGGPAASSTPAGSPFEQPAFWEQPSADTHVEGAAPTGHPGRIRMTKTPTSSDQPAGSSPYAAPEPRTTPPAWDPLGVAPFAWDLPEPTPLAPAGPAPRSRSGIVIGRVTMGATLLIGGLTAAGVFAGWWTLTWAQVSGIALAVLGLGLLFSALRGRGYSLIGPGVFLSLVTLALAVTGVSGTADYGSYDERPTSLADVKSSYLINGGDLTLDLSAITIPVGADTKVDVKVGGGHANVTLPATMNVKAFCEVGAGAVSCLGDETGGAMRKASGSVSNKAGGTLILNVKVNGGFAEVRSND